jgi:hypothetical protein
VYPCRGRGVRPRPSEARMCPGRPPLRLMKPVDLSPVLHQTSTPVAPLGIDEPRALPKGGQFGRRSPRPIFRLEVMSDPGRSGCRTCGLGPTRSAVADVVTDLDAAGGQRAQREHRRDGGSPAAAGRGGGVAQYATCPQPPSVDPAGPARSTRDQRRSPWDQTHPQSWKARRPPAGTRSGGTRATVRARSVKPSGMPAHARRHMRHRPSRPQTNVARSCRSNSEVPPPLQPRGTTCSRSTSPPHPTPSSP